MSDLELYKKLYVEKKTDNIFLKYNIYLTAPDDRLFWFYFVVFNKINMMNIIKLSSNYNYIQNFIIFYFSFLLSDFISGIIHIYLDNSKIKYNETIIDFYRLGFQVHHKFPLYQLKIHPDYKAYYECNTLFFNIILLSIINLYLFDSLIIHYISYLLLIMQANHYYCHFYICKLEIPYFIKFLHKYNILMTPKQHSIHHTTFDINFCLINGSINPILNYLYLNKYFDNFILFIDWIIG